LAHLRLIPRHVTEAPLHGANAGRWGLQGNGFDGFAFEGAELPHHGAEKMVARLTAPKTMAESGMEATEFIDKALDLIRSQVKGRRIVKLPWGTTSR